MISDSTLQRHVVCRLVESVGYRLAASMTPDAISADKIRASQADVWLVDIEDEELWGDSIVVLYDLVDVPILFGEGNAPSTSSLQYQRWQKKISAKLESVVGKPLYNGSVVPTLDSRIDLVVPAAEAKKNLPGEPASCIWVLGASLGGPSAVKEFLHALPAKLPVSFLVAQHIEPGFQETLTKVWGGTSATKFIPIDPGLQIRHGQSAIVPLEQVMVLNQYSQITLYDEPWQGPYAPCINQVMTLMAEQFGAQTGAILFSGMGEDGTEGATFMRERGIEVWAQSAESCANSSMPDSARKAGQVTFSGTPTELAAHLTRYLMDDEVELLAN